MCKIDASEQVCMVGMVLIHTVVCELRKFGYRVRYLEMVRTFFVVCCHLHSSLTSPEPFYLHNFMR